MVQPDADALSARRQCELLGLARSTLYDRPVEVRAENLALMRRIDALCTARPLFGSRRIVDALSKEPWVVNRKQGSQYTQKHHHRTVRAMPPSRYTRYTVAAHTCLRSVLCDGSRYMFSLVSNPSTW